VSSTINPKGTTLDIVRLWLFPFSLLEKAKTWFYSNKEAFTTWEACSNAFLDKYFPVGKTNALRNRISRIQQMLDETISQKSGNVSRTTSKHAHTTSWKSY
jgi:hypothetical protein